MLIRENRKLCNGLVFQRTLNLQGEPKGHQCGEEEWCVKKAGFGIINPLALGQADPVIWLGESI